MAARKAPATPSTPTARPKSAARSTAGTTPADAAAPATTTKTRTAPARGKAARAAAAPAPAPAPAKATPPLTVTLKQLAAQLAEAHAMPRKQGEAVLVMPRVVQPNASKPLFYSVGYGGNGVSYSAQAGWRMAALVAGKGGRHALPIYQGELPGHALAPFGRLGPRLLYQLYLPRDERPDAVSG